MTELEEAKEVGRQLFNEGMQLKARIRELEARLATYEDEHKANIRLMEDLTEASGAVCTLERKVNGLESAVVNLSTQNTRLLGVIENLVLQFAYHTERPVGLTTGGMSALEAGFEALGWENPHPTPGLACDEPGCGRMATCGFPADDGEYRRTCSLHFHPPNEEGAP